MLCMNKHPFNFTLIFLFGNITANLRPTLPAKRLTSKDPQHNPKPNPCCAIRTFQLRFCIKYLIHTLSDVYTFCLSSFGQTLQALAYLCWYLSWHTVSGWDSVCTYFRLWITLNRPPGQKTLQTHTYICGCRFFLFKSNYTVLILSHLTGTLSSGGYRQKIQLK